jgi:hypothetical protein
VDEHEDLVRRDELFQKWRGRPPPLTGEEDAEEAHLFARIAAFKQETVRVSTARLTSGGGGPNAYLHLPIPRPSAAGFRRFTGRLAKSNLSLPSWAGCVPMPSDAAQRGVGLG